MGAFFGKTRVLRRVEVATTQDEYSIDDEGPGYDASARTVVRVPRRGTKGLVQPAFMLTGERPDPSKNPREEFARMLTSHPQFARTAVNLLWAEMFGVGIVDPPLDFDLARIDPKNPPPAPWALQPTHPELLEALANYFREHNYSLRSVIKLIAESSTYQLSSRFEGEWEGALCEVFCAQVRAPPESRGDSRFSRARDRSLHGYTDSRNRFYSEVCYRDPIARGFQRQRSDAEGRELLSRVFRADQP